MHVIVSLLCVTRTSKPEKVIYKSLVQGSAPYDFLTDIPSNPTPIHRLQYYCQFRFILTDVRCTQVRGPDCRFLANYCRTGPENLGNRARYGLRFGSPIYPPSGRSRTSSGPEFRQMFNCQLRLFFHDVGCTQVTEYYCRFLANYYFPFGKKG